ncbi:MAG: hypothetical protein MJ168_01400 [Clostridia bacterium]|nr:hypothetical protein [Clostridia bacterium]
MEKKNQKKRAIYAAIAMLLVSAIVMTTASFAWFSLGRSAQVDNLDLKVTKEGEGIAISANASKFTDTITFEELQGTASSDFKAVSTEYNYFPERISPSSSEFTTNSLPAFFTGGIDKVAKKMYATASTSADGKTIYGKGNDEVPSGATAASFYAFDIFIKLEGKDSAKIKMSNSAINVTADPDESREEGNAAFYEATAKAMRMGFVNCGVTTSENQTPSGTEATIFGIAESDARNTKPVKAAGEYDVAEGASTVTSLSTSYACQVDQGSEDVTLTLSRGVNQLRVYIWMEGQDANCTNDLMSEYISANIVFTLV